MLDLRTERFQIDRLHIVHEEHRMRIADIDRHRSFQRTMADRHVRGVDGIGQRDRFPIEMRLPHRHFGQIVGAAFQYAGDRLYPHMPADQRHDAARGIAAGLRIAAVGIDDAHAQVRCRRGREDDQLVAADAMLAVRNGGGLRRGGRKGFLARIDDHEVVAEPVHLVKTAIVHAPRFRIACRSSPAVAGTAGQPKARRHGD